MQPLWKAVWKFSRSALPRLKWNDACDLESYLSSGAQKGGSTSGGKGEIAIGILSGFGGCGGKDNSKLTDNFFLKIKTRTTTWSRTSTPGYLSKENRRASLKIYRRPNAHRNIIYNSQDLEDTSVFIRIIDEWIKKI